MVLSLIFPRRDSLALAYYTYIYTRLPRTSREAIFYILHHRDNIATPVDHPGAGDPRLTLWPPFFNRNAGAAVLYSFDFEKRETSDAAVAEEGGACKRLRLIGTLLLFFSRFFFFPFLLLLLHLFLQALDGT